MRSGPYTPEEITEGIRSIGGLVYGVLWMGCILTLTRLKSPTG